MTTASTTTSTTTATAARAPRLALSGVLTRRLLALDAVGCAALGIVGTFGASALDDRLGAATSLLVGTGVALLAYAAAAALVARRPSRGGLLSLVAANTGFAAASVLVAVTVELTAAGVVVAAGLAVVSLIVADLLLLGLRGDAGRA